MLHPFHKEILQLIKENSGKATQHTFSENYLGNNHPCYAISAPVLRRIAKEWVSQHKDLSSEEFAQLLTSLIEGHSFTEKVMAGIVLDTYPKTQYKFNPEIFDRWLDNLEGWAEVDSVCTGKYTRHEIPANFKKWKLLITAFSKNENINKRRAALVFFTTPLRYCEDENLATLALTVIDRLKHEKDILITRAISWVLRSMTKMHRKTLEHYLKENADSLPKVALRETMTKLTTGKKTNAPL